MENNQKGVSLIITFLIMTVMLAIILNLSAILFSEIKITKNIGDSMSSLYSAVSGAEEALYFDRKQAPVNSNRGLCNICEICDELTNCGNCLSISLATNGSNGCDPLSCVNCQVMYTSFLDNGDYEINAKVIPSGSNPDISIFNLLSKGNYKDASRSVELNIVE